MYLVFDSKEKKLILAAIKFMFDNIPLKSIESEPFN